MSEDFKYTKAMTIQEAIKSGKRHRRPRMKPKWYPKCERYQNTLGDGEVWSWAGDEYHILTVSGYYCDDVMQDDWEVEE